MAVCARSNASSGVWTPFRPKAREHFVVEDDREPSEPTTQGHEAVGLVATQDVEGEQHVVRHVGVGEDLDLAEFLARDPDGARGHLHPANLGDLVRFDVRPVGDAVLVQVRLHPADVGFHDVEIDGHGRRVEVARARHPDASLPGTVAVRVLHRWRSLNPTSLGARSIPDV